jgi:aminoglycoside phosphotransferase (APT) family kinase protein
VQTACVTEIDEALVSELVAEQFPQWRDLPVRRVRRQGWDNRTFRLGDELSVRLPSAEGYVAAVEKEDRVLRFLGSVLPLSVPSVVALGVPGSGYPYPWSVRNWLPGETVVHTPDLDRRRLARDLGAVLSTLRALPADDGPAAGSHSHFRGCHPSVYSDQVDHALRDLAPVVDVERCREIWLTATTSVWPAKPVWYHGDLAVGNMLAAEGRLSALIDFGACGVGDPACDLVMAWTYFVGEERTEFRESAGLADEVWRRARGWALWKALVTMAGLSQPDPAQTRIITEVLTDPVV